MFSGLDTGAYYDLIMRGQDVFFLVSLSEIPNARRCEFRRMHHELCSRNAFLLQAHFAPATGVCTKMPNKKISPSHLA